MSRVTLPRPEWLTQPGEKESGKRDPAVQAVRVYRDLGTGRVAAQLVHLLLGQWPVHGLELEILVLAQDGFASGLQVIAVFAPGTLGHGQGFVGRIGDVLVIGVQELPKDFPCRLWADEGCRLDGREQEGLVGVR